MKKILAISLAFLMIFSCVSVALAADTVLSTALDLTAMETVNNLSTEGWAWDNETKTLTLDGLNLVTDTTPAINLPADATVILADGSVNNVATTAASGIGILANGDLIVKTADGAKVQGSLTVKAETAGSSTIGISLVDPPVDANVSFYFYNVIIDITARRGIQILNNDGSKKYELSMELDSVNYTFKSNKNVNGYRPLQVWNEKNGDSTLTVKNSTINGEGIIMCAAKGYTDTDGNLTEGNSVVNIINSTVCSTESLYSQNATNNVMNIENSYVKVPQIRVGQLGAHKTSTLNINKSTVIAGPQNTTYASLEVGINGAVSSEAHLKDSVIMAIANRHDALSVSRQPTAEEKEEYGSQANAKARGLLTIENCEMLLAGAKYFGNLVDKANHEGSHVTAVLYPSATVDTSEEGVVKITVPEGTVIYTDEGVNYTTTEETVLTVYLDKKLMSVPAGTTLTKHTEETEETRTLDEDMTFILGESLKVVYDVTYTDVQVENGKLYAAKGEDYIFTMPENLNNELNVTIGGVAYTNYTVDGNTVTISGADITGEVAISLHSYKWETVKEVSCGENGSKKEVCIGCGAEGETQEISATGNHTLSTVTLDADCTTAGEKVTVCANCDYMVVEVIAAKGHSYDDGVITTNATCSAEGVKTFTCGECNATRTETIPSTECVDENHDGKCDVCKEVMEKVASCRCLCHSKDGFIRFIYQILLVLMKAFNIHRECVCGMYHF